MLNGTTNSTMTRPTDAGVVRDCLLRRDPEFWTALADATRRSTDFTDVLTLSNLRRKGERSGVPGAAGKVLRLAIVGGSNLYPFQELLEQMLGAAQRGGWWKTEMFVGEYDNYATELLEVGGALDRFEPDLIVLIPSDGRCGYGGSLTDGRDEQQSAAVAQAEEVLGLCRAAHDRTGAEVIVTNFLLPAEMDPGAYRTRSLGSAWNFRKIVNLELGLRAPEFVHVCDVEFLASRRGLETCVDARRWFESKQIYSPEFAVDVAREMAQIAGTLRRAPKKVLVLDLDDTLWGGVIGDDGMAGIEIGTTTPRGEAFRAFQECIQRLSKRGVLLAVCSKNDLATALEPFERHPEMVLRREDLASFQAGWEPKPEGLRRIAEELGLGLDSMVFVDDNPAEIEIVRQFLPEVETIYLGGDPAEYVAQLLNARMFEPRAITADDLRRCQQYQQQARRTEMLAAEPNMATYLDSLQMRCEFQAFAPVDLPRIAQLINKSNQFNLTTRRRSEAEVCSAMMDAGMLTLSARVRDRFGDSGLISVVIAEVKGTTATIDTWLMSCRVLNREIEFEVLRELVWRAGRRSCDQVIGVYRKSARSGMVRDLFPRLGFREIERDAEEIRFALRLADFVPRMTAIAVERADAERF